ncbi:hypothetical protein DdX_05846 [Ditylenchus destructor]|uniref:Uncharacterized protein n=1 Tax=Ditylenchus destructor TaxID=166010 RepID=A0AAD4NB19_9BILA|nr:hypothetical protein DdX_05846 [Ditylenchus destructor]
MPYKDQLTSIEKRDWREMAYFQFRGQMFDQSWGLGETQSRKVLALDRKYEKFDRDESCFVLQSQLKARFWRSQCLLSLIMLTICSLSLTSKHIHVIGQQQQQSLFDLSTMQTAKNAYKRCGAR